MSEYETSSQCVRDCYSLNAETHAVSPERAERFDRWLAIVKAEAWDVGYESGVRNATEGDPYVVDVNPYREAIPTYLGVEE